VRGDTFLTDDGPPTVTVSVSSADASAMEMIVVEDNGPGFAEDQRRVLLEDAASNPERSDGLGLRLINWGVRQVGAGSSTRRTIAAAAS